MKHLDNLNKLFLKRLSSEPQLQSAVLLGKIRLGKVKDDIHSIDDLMGDCFDPILNTDIPPGQLKKDKSAFLRRVSAQSVWAFYVEYWDGREWHQSDMCGGFVGNDFFGSGYEVGFANEAFTAYQAQTLDADGYVIDVYRQANAA